MHNLNIYSPPSDSKDITNLQIIESSLNNNSYSYWIGAKDLEQDTSAAAATFVTGTDTLPAHWVLADVTISGIGFYIRRHEDWKYGSFDLKVHWSSTVAANDVLFIRKCDRFNTDGTSVAGTSRDIAVAYLYGVNEIRATLLSDSGFRSDSLMDSSRIGMYIHLRRGVSSELDTNTGSVLIYGIELIYNEVKRVIGNIVKR